MIFGLTVSEISKRLDTVPIASLDALKFASNNFKLLRKGDYKPPEMLENDKPDVDEAR